MSTAAREIQYAIRRLRASPGFTIAATLTLAIAIGATASVFSVVDGVLLKAFPYRAPDRVLAIWATNQDWRRTGVSPAQYLDWRAQSHDAIDLAAWTSGVVTETGEQEPTRDSAWAVTPNFFPVLGITPVLGRPLSADSGGPAEVVVGFPYWRRRFGGNPSVIGRKLTLGGQPYTIVGVMPEGVPWQADVYTRLSFQGTDLIHREQHYLWLYGRLKQGVTPERGQRELQTIAQRLARTYPKTDIWSVGTLPLLDQVFGAGDPGATPSKPALIMLLAAAAFVLLIGAANLANLFLVRGLARERELALRTALGASRVRIARELLIEAAVLGFGAATIGVAIAVWGVGVLRALGTGAILPRLNQIEVDSRVVGFCALTLIATVLLVGALPAWRASRADPAVAVKEAGGGTVSRRRGRLQETLVVFQVAVTLVLLAGAGLLDKSFEQFWHRDRGFRPDGVLVAAIDLPDRYATPAQVAAFASRLVERLAATPGARSASVSSAVPGTALGRFAFRVVGDPAPDPEHEPAARPIFTTPDYFRTLGISLRRGRGVLSTDDDRAVKVAVVDELLVKRMFGTRNPIGRRLTFDQPGWDTTTVTIVGVAAHVDQGGLIDEAVPALYMPLAQLPWADPFGMVAMRTAGDPESQAAVIKTKVFNLDPTVPVSGIRTMNAQMASSVAMTRFASFLASLFAVVAFTLSIVGIYGVLAYVVRQRQREIGIRIALGASSSRVMSDVIRRAAALTGMGILLGAGAAWVLTRVLAALFVGVNPHDPATFVGAATAFAVVALAAAAVPAFRATQVNPVTALNST